MAVTVSGLSSSPTTGTLSSPGIGSGLDVAGIISKLMAVEQQPLVDLQTQQASYTAKLTAVASVKGAVSTFQSAVAALNDTSKFTKLSASVGDSSMLSASASSSAAAGSYNIAITNTAAAQTLSSAGYANTTSPIGTGGTLTVQFGTYSGSTFTLNPNQGTQNITISPTQNTLAGIRDAINQANAGVTASIINDGSTNGNHLVLTSSNTGAAYAMKISSTDATLNSAFGYDGTVGGNPMTETAAAKDALLTINGVTVTKPTNTITDAIAGVTLNLLKANGATTTTLTVAKDTSGSQASVQSFVSAFNDLTKTLKQLTAYDSTNKQAAVLLGDPTVLSIESQLERMLDTALPSSAGGLSTLMDIGISFQKDGTLALDTTKLQKVLSDSSKDVSALFASVGKATDSLVAVTGSTTSTKPGTYAVNVTQLATQGTALGTGTAPAPTTTITAGSNDTLIVTIDGNSATVTLPPGTYTPTQLAAQIQAAINGNSTLAGAGSGVAVSLSGGQILITSNRYGSASKVSIDGGTAAAAAGLDSATTTTGVDVAGTIGGVTATGSGQVLTGSGGASGLALTITGTATGDRGTVTFGQGYAYLLNQLTQNFLDDKGPLTAETDAINASITANTNQQAVVRQRLTAIQARYQAQFAALDTTIASLSATQSFLNQQLSYLNNLAYGVSSTSGKSGG